MRFEATRRLLERLKERGEEDSELREIYLAVKEVFDDWEREHKENAVMRFEEWKRLFEGGEG